MHLLALLAGSIAPTGYRSFVYLERVDNRLDGTAIRQ